MNSIRRNHLLSCYHAVTLIVNCTHALDYVVGLVVSYSGRTPVAWAVQGSPSLLCKGSWCHACIQCIEQLSKAQEVLDL